MNFTLGDVAELGGWCVLWTRDGHTYLGTHDTEQEAREEEARLRASYRVVLAVIEAGEMVERVLGKGA